MSGSLGFNLLNLRPRLLILSTLLIFFISLSISLPTSAQTIREVEQENAANNYKRLRDAVNSQCAITTKPVMNAAPYNTPVGNYQTITVDRNNKYSVVTVDDGKEMYGTYSYIIALGSGLQSTVNRTIEPQGGSSTTCSRAIQQMSALTGDVVEFNNRNPSQAVGGFGSTASLGTDIPVAGSEPAEIKPTCTAGLSGIGWWLCSVLEQAVGFADGMWGIVDYFMTVDPLSDDSPVYSTWQTLRNIANALLVVVFLVVVFSQISNIGISNYGIKKMLPRLIVMAVLVNISYFFVQITIDLANISGRIIDNLLQGTMTINFQNLKFTDVLDEIVGGLGVAAATGAAAAGVGALIGGPAVLIFLAVLLIPVVVGFIATILTLGIRASLVPIIAILAPIALVAYVLPNTQGLFDKWRKLFFGIVFLYPAASLYFGALKLGASLTMANDSSVVMKMLAMTMLVAGSGFIVVIALKSNSIMGKMYGSAAGLINKAAKPVQKLGMGVAGSRAALKFAQFKNQDHSSVRGPGSAGFLGGKKLMRGVGRSLQRFDDSSTARKTAMDASQVASQERFRDKLLEGYDPDNPNSMNDFALEAAGGDVNAARSMQRKVHLTRKEEDFKKASAELNEDFNRAKTTPGFNDDKFLQERILTANSDSERDAALHRAGGMGRDQVIRDVQNAAHFTQDKSLMAAAGEAIEANKSTLLPRSPDLIKGEDAAFSSVTGRQLTQFSNQTLQRYIGYIGSIKDTTKRDLAMQSFNSAMTDIKNNSELQADLRGDAGRMILKEYNGNSAQLSAMSQGIGFIDQNTGKIR